MPEGLMLLKLGAGAHRKPFQASLHGPQHAPALRAAGAQQGWLLSPSQAALCSGNQRQ